MFAFEFDNPGGASSSSTSGPRHASAGRTVAPSVKTKKPHAKLEIAAKHAGAVVGSSSSYFHDKLWCMHTVRHIRFLAENDEKGLSNSVFAIRMSMPVVDALLVARTLHDTLIHEAPLGPASSSFKFEGDGDYLGDKIKHADAPIVDPISENRLFFSVLNLKPAAYHVLDHAIRITDSDAVGAYVHQLAEYDRKLKRIRTLVPDTETNIHEKVVIFTGTTFIKAELDSAFVFDSSAVQVHDFGVRAPPELLKPLATVTESLLPTGASDVAGSGRSTYTLVPDSDAGFLPALKFLMGHDFVESVVSGPDRSSWRLTDLGKRSLRSSHLLENRRRLTDARSEVPLDELEIVELHTKLKENEWTHHVKTPRYRPDAYIIGMPKVWYLSESTKLFSRLYFLCLLQAHEHKQPVPHGASANRYQCILSGREYRRPKKKTGTFAFGAEVHPDTLCKTIGKRPAKLAPEPPAGEDDETGLLSEPSDSHSDAASSDEDSPEASSSSSSSSSSSTDRFLKVLVLNSAMAIWALGLRFWHLAI